MTGRIFTHRMLRLDMSYSDKHPTSNVHPFIFHTCFIQFMNCRGGRSSIVDIVHLFCAENVFTAAMVFMCSCSISGKLHYPHYPPFLSQIIVKKLSRSCVSSGSEHRCCVNFNHTHHPSHLCALRRALTKYQSC